MPDRGVNGGQQWCVLRIEVPQGCRKCGKRSLHGRGDMSFLVNVDHPGLPLRPSARVSHPSPSDGGRFQSLPPDRVEFSELGRQLADSSPSSSLRIARVQAIRNEIAAGVYETPERIEGVVSRLLDVLV